VLRIGQAKVTRSIIILKKMERNFKRFHWNMFRYQRRVA
jgi:hypothetical protein